MSDREVSNEGTELRFQASDFAAHLRNAAVGRAEFVVLGSIGHGTGDAGAQDPFIDFTGKRDDDVVLETGAADGQSQFAFPALNGADAFSEVAGDFFPGTQNVLTWYILVIHEDLSAGTGGRNELVGVLLQLLRGR